MNLPRFFTLWVVALSLVVSLRAAKPAGELAFAIDVPDGLRTSEVHKAVLDAATGRGYGIVEDKPDHLVLKLVKHRHEANFAVNFDDKLVKLYSDSYKIDSTGARVEKEVPDGWLGYLKEDIAKNLAGIASAKK